MYSMDNRRLRLFLVHPGGPFFRNKDEGNWTLPKGEVEENEDFLQTARREFAEETGLQHAHPEHEYIPLGNVKLKSGKTVHAWAFEGTWDGTPVKSNMFGLEWPLHSGQISYFPEIDRAEWFTPTRARTKIHPAQLPFIERLEQYLLVKEA